VQLIWKKATRTSSSALERGACKAACREVSKAGVSPQTALRFAR
jgi:hypothetical protein